MAHIGVRISKESRKMLDELAKETEKTISEIIRELIEEELTNDVQLYCDYVDSAIAELKKDLPRLVMEIVKQPKVQAVVDENSLRRVQQKISNMLDGIFGKR